ncbi:MAG TPA: helix-turn-helix domain-containing protein [Acidimicrobiales bacterium]
MSEAGDATRKALLDAGEELLISKGMAAITTRKVAEQAGVNQALVHYHFGTIEELLLAVLERVSVQVKERSQEIYGSHESFMDGWFEEMQAMITADFERGWGKIWLENLTLAANRPTIRKQYVKASTMTRKLHERQVSDMLDEEGVDARLYPAQAIVTLLDAITQKLILDRLVGIKAGHSELLAMLRRIWGQVEQELQEKAVR